MKKEIKAVVKEVFESNENLKEVHVCTNGMCFENGDMARSHQIELSGKAEDVIFAKREDVIGDSNAEAEAKAKAETEAKAKAEAEAKAKAETEAKAKATK